MDSDFGSSGNREIWRVLRAADLRTGRARSEYGLPDWGFRGEARPAMNDDLQAALSALPHGTSFRFLDGLESLVPGVEATAIYQIRGDEAFLEGHFPGNPMMPGVILIEAIAQLGGVVVQTDPDHAVMSDLRLTGVRGAKILGAAVPGDCLRIRAKVEGRLGGLVQVEGEVSGPAGVLATSKVTLSGTLV